MIITVRAFIEKLEELEKLNKNAGISIETIDDNGEIYFTEDFDIFFDDHGDIGLSPINN